MHGENLKLIPTCIDAHCIIFREKQLKNKKFTVWPFIIYYTFYCNMFSELR